MDEAARTAIAKHNAVEWYTERADALALVEGAGIWVTNARHFASLLRRAAQAEGDDPEPPGLGAALDVPPPTYTPGMAIENVLVAR